MSRSTIGRLSLTAEVMMSALDFVPYQQTIQRTLHPLFISWLTVQMAENAEASMVTLQQNQALLQHIYCPFHTLPMPLAHPLCCHQTDRT